MNNKLPSRQSILSWHEIKAYIDGLEKIAIPNDIKVNDIIVLRGGSRQTVIDIRSTLYGYNVEPKVRFRKSNLIFTSGIMDFVFKMDGGTLANIKERGLDIIQIFRDGKLIAGHKIKFTIV